PEQLERALVAEFLDRPALFDLSRERREVEPVLFGVRPMPAGRLQDAPQDATPPRTRAGAVRRSCAMDGLGLGRLVPRLPPRELPHHVIVAIEHPSGPAD